MQFATEKQISEKTDAALQSALKEFKAAFRKWVILMASMRDIKRRRSSIASTQQITNAMKLVSTVKLQKTKARAERSKPYFDKMYATVTSMLAKSGTIEHPYLKPQASGKKASLSVTSNRGLAAGTMPV